MNCNFRIGHGYDVHRFAPNRKLMLCGVEVDYELGLDGHSDADVAIHALCDAILGALGKGDIGKHFPDTDPQYKGIDSTLLLKHVVDLAHENGYKIANGDITIIAQKPKLMSYIPQMKEKMTELCSAEINIKATTEEGLGFTGSLEGISSHAVVLIYKE